MAGEQDLFNRASDGFMGDNIFISYRRQDAAGAAGRLYDSLAAHFGPERVFMDVSNIRGGEDFVRRIDATLDAAGAVLVVIGTAWLTAAGDDGRPRLDHPDDYVRREVDGALRRSVPVIPVLVDGAGMPREEDLPEPLRPLARRNALSIHHDRWTADVRRLTGILEIDVSGSAAEKRFHRLRTLVFGFFVAAIILPIIQTQLYGTTPPEAGAPYYWPWHVLRYLIWLALIGALIVLAGLLRFVERTRSVLFWISLGLAGLSLILSEKGLEIWAIVPLALILMILNLLSFRPR